MQVNVRRENRRPANALYSISWETSRGVTRAAQVQGSDLSASGICLKMEEELKPGANVYVQAQDGHPTGYATVRHCERRASGFAVGLEFSLEMRQTMGLPSEHFTDFYEFLQISPRAECATIHRVYRFLAARFHPDNPETGDPEKFVMLNRAYDVLSDPRRRADYDASRSAQHSTPIPIFETGAFVNGIEGEANRRLGILSLLYNRRRTSPDHPHVSLLELEKWMAFPREYLDFTTWYLRNKKYIAMEDNSDFSLTALGVDYVEANVTRNPMLRKLLAAGAPTVTSATGSDEGNSCGNCPAELPYPDAAD